MQAKTKVLSVGRALQGEVTALSQVEKPMENLCHAHGKSVPCRIFFHFFPTILSDQSAMFCCSAEVLG